MDTWQTIAARDDYVDAWQLFDQLTMRPMSYGEGLRLVERLGKGVGQLRQEYWVPEPHFSGTLKDGGKGCWQTRRRRATGK